MQRHPVRLAATIVVAMAVLITAAACEPAGPPQNEQFTDPSSEITSSSWANFVDPAVTNATGDIPFTEVASGPRPPDADVAGQYPARAQTNTTVVSGGVSYYVALDVTAYGGSSTSSGCRQVDAKVTGKSIEWLILGGGNLNPFNLYPDVYNVHETMRWCWNLATHVVHQSGTGDSWWTYTVDPSSVASVDYISPPFRERYEYRSGYPDSGILIEDTSSICNCIFTYGRTATVYPWVGIFGHDNGTYTIEKHNKVPTT